MRAAVAGPIVSAHREKGSGDHCLAKRRCFSGMCSDSRVPFRGLDGRAIRDVSRTEIASVIEFHRRDLASAEDSVLTLSRRLGIARLSKDARAYVSDCARWREATAGVET